MPNMKRCRYCGAEYATRAQAESHRRECAARTAAKSAACQYCAQAIVSDGFRQQHEAVCVCNPAVEPLVKRALTELGKDGYMASFERYNDYRHLFGRLPHGRSIRASLGLDWKQVAAWVGLEPPRYGNTGNTREERLARRRDEEARIEAEIERHLDLRRREAELRRPPMGMPVLRVREEVRRLRGRDVLCEVYELR